MTKQKLVRPQMTAEARDILKSWDGKTNSEKVKSANGFKNYTISLEAALNNTDSLYKAKCEDVEYLSAVKDSYIKELSTIAGYLAISICINFVAIGWVAWTKGWLS